ncbi:MAG: hypothetical protein MI976_28530 [Pseudomonadales bacterium]|nr:hypothetical protein [Pseudomonadales bacterium]
MKRVSAFGFISIITLVLLSSCGFQLRGSLEIPDSYQQLSLKANPKSNFTKALIEQLQINNIDIVEDAPYQLVIVSDENEKRTVSYNSRGKSAENEVIKRISFALKDTTNKLSVLPSKTLQARRTYLFDDTKVSAMKEQEKLIREELEYSLAIKLLMHLQEKPQQIPKQ